MILDLVGEAGNPADSDRLPMLEHRLLRQRATSGGSRRRPCYAQQLGRSEGLGRSRHGLPQKGLRIEDMVKRNWVYRKLRNFRAGIEAGISCLKRAYGLGAAAWITSRAMSGPRSWPITSSSSRASNRPDADPHCSSAGLQPAQRRARDCLAATLLTKTRGLEPSSPPR